MDKENAEKAVDAYDNFVGAEVCLPDARGRKMISRVTTSVKNNEGNPRGIEHPTLFVYHSLYDISFPNVRTEELIANVIADNMLSQVDSEVNQYQVLKEISYHYADGIALKRSSRFIRSCGRKLHANNTTIGWKLEVEWKDGTLRWILLKDLKTSNPVKLSEYAVSNNI